MYDSEEEGEDGPGDDRTCSGVTLGGNVFNPNVGEAAMGTARLLDIIRLDIEDRYGGTGIWFTVAAPYWVAYVGQVSHVQSLG